MNAMVPQGPFTIAECPTLIWNAEHLVLPWMAARIEGMEGLGFGPASAVGVVKDGRIAGGVAYAFWYDHPEGGDVQISMVMEPGTRVTRQMWRLLYGHAFVTMRCRRMSLQILKKNRKARDHVERAGFRVEGCKRQAHGRQDIILYGLLKAECKFL